MKYWIKYLFCLFLLTVVSCGSSTYKLSGLVRDEQLEGKTVYLTDALNWNEKYDSVVVKNGRFRMEGEVAKPVLRQLYMEIDGAFHNYLPIVLEQGVIQVVFDTMVYTGNTPLNERMQDFLLAKSNFIDNHVAGDSVVPAFSVQFSSFLKDEILKNSDNLIGEYIYRAYSTKLTDEDKKDILKRASITLVEKLQKERTS